MFYVCLELRSIRLRTIIAGGLLLLCMLPDSCANPRRTMFADKVREQRITRCLYREGYHETFDEKGPNRFWQQLSYTDADSGIVGWPAWQGGALKITVHPGDHRYLGSDGSGTERNEIYTRHAYAFNRTYWVSFAFYVPPDFPVVDERLVLGQWKQNTIKFWKMYSPLIAQRFRQGEFSLTINRDDERETLYQTGSPEAPALLGRWTRMRYQFRFSQSSDGLLRVWMNDQQIVDFSGPLSNPSDFTDSAILRLGLYRDGMDEPMTLYLDEFRQGSRRSHVD